MIKCEICTILEKFEKDYFYLKTGVEQTCYYKQSYEPYIQGFRDLTSLVDKLRVDLGLKK